MIDLTLTGLLDFSATSSVATWTSPKGQDFFEFFFGQGSVKVTLPKTGASEMEQAARDQGLKVRLI